MDNKNLVIIWLSLQIAVISWFWMKAEKKVSYLEGQQHIFDMQAEAEDHVCGPYEQPTTAEKRAKKHV